jgi:hypothetical protein
MENDQEFKKSLIHASSLIEQFKARGQWNVGAGFGTLEAALKYPTNLYYHDYLERYEKQDIAHRVLQSPVLATWATNPVVTESDIEETAFEKAWVELVERLNIFTEFSKVDLLSRIGSYAALFIGAADGFDPSMPLKRGAKIMYINPLPEPCIKIVSWDQDPTSSRFGAPLYYDVNIEYDDTESSMTRKVHWTRIIHVAQDTLSDKYHGIPALKPIYNRLIGLEKLASGSPEMYWRGARPGYVASSGSNVLATDKQIEDYKEAISDFINDLNRYLFAEDLTIQSLAPQVVTPREHVDVQLQLISAAMMIPLRILIGSERGELSSDQDERAWLTYVESRRDIIGKKLIIRPFIDRLIELSILPTPKTGYFIRWAPLVVLSDRDNAEIARLYADAIKKYDESITVRDIIPPEVFTKYILGLDEEAIALAKNIVDNGLVEETEKED